MEEKNELSEEALNAIEKHLEKISELSATLQSKDVIIENYKTTVEKLERMVSDLRVENESLKNESFEAKKNADSYYSWWQREAETTTKLKESIKAVSVVVSAMAKEVSKP